MKMQKLAILLLTTTIILGQGLSGRRAPSFALPDANMKSYDILDYRGRWLLLDYMKTDRPASKPLSKELAQLKARIGAKVAILQIVLPPDNTATVAKYIADTKTTIPILFDSGQSGMWYFKVTPERPQFDSPHLFAINPQGMLVRDWNQTAIEKGGYLPQLEALLAGGAGKKK
ncbi:MAG: redoxin domain-containing protein [Acidobacteriota bacterium]